MTIQALSELIVWHSSSTLHIQMLGIYLKALVAVVCFSALIIKALFLSDVQKLAHFSKEWAKFLVFVNSIDAQAILRPLVQATPVLSCVQTAGSAQLCMLRGSSNKENWNEPSFRLLD